jgi:hypothetical protein
MDGTWEGLAFGEDSESVGKVGHVVLWGHIGVFDGFVALKDL